MKKQPWSIRTSRFLDSPGRPASSLAGAVALRATGPKITILVFPAAWAAAYKRPDGELRPAATLRVAPAVYRRSNRNSGGLNMNQLLPFMLLR